MNRQKLQQEVSNEVFDLIGGVIDAGGDYG